MIFENDANIRKKKEKSKKFATFAFMKMKEPLKKIELLAPAKTGLFGIEAINHGADAVYIGAPKFGARMAASNTLEEIETLTRYAHLYGAKVHVALNTILTDSELKEANRLIKSLYEIGIDALIIQDLGLLTLDLPPIELHASTQLDNRTIEKIHLLENLGFDRVVLARELSLSEIQKIHSKSKIELEAFIHGALCVSYSGQCYVSQAFTGRSANKGACAQLCRLPYTLKDQFGTKIREDQFLLSLKDMDRSSYLKEILESGVTSLKIEGRLKDLSYVKNITGYYRKKLDALFVNDSEYRSSSYGKTTLFFDPQPEKTFHRDKTTYFLNGRESVMSEVNTPKSIGEKVGIITDIKRDYLCFEGSPLANGDGVIFINQEGFVDGFRINRVEENKIFPASFPEIEKGTVLYRNFNQTFEKLLEKKSPERKIGVSLIWKEVESGFELFAEDERGCAVSKVLNIEKTISRQSTESKEQIISILEKLGNTIYSAESVVVDMTQNYFIPSSLATGIRREVVELLDQKWIEISKQSSPKRLTKTNHPIVLNEHLNYLSNVMNNSAKKIYFDLGVKEIDDAFEKNEPSENVILMQCKHCIKYSLGFCPKQPDHQHDIKFKEPLILEHQKIKLQLDFDCKECVMLVSHFDQKR